MELRVPKQFGFHLLFLALLVLILSVKEANAQKKTYSKTPKGSLANDFDARFQISLRFQDGFHFCSAALIKIGSVHYGITAAQCFHHEIHPVFAFMGEIRLDTNNSTGNLQRRLVTNVSKHGDFTLPQQEVVRGDMAVLHFESNFIEVKLWTVVEPINFHKTPHSLSKNHELKIQGWGIMYPGAPDEMALQILTTEYIAGGQCKDISKMDTKWVWKDFDHKIMDCYYPPTIVGPGECHGDAGALVIVEDGGTYLYGVVSMGHDCYYKDYPGVFSTIYCFTFFIYSNTPTPEPANCGLNY